MKKIWTIPLTIELLNARNRGSLSDYLGITFHEIGDNYLTAEMPVTAHHLQPFGIMHGGASCALAETVGSIAATYCVNPETHYCVGIDINTNHISAVRSGTLTAIAKPYHLGRLTQVWSIKITTPAKLVSVSRLTIAVLPKSPSDTIT